MAAMAEQRQQQQQQQEEEEEEAGSGGASGSGRSSSSASEREGRSGGGFPVSVRHGAQTLQVEVSHGGRVRDLMDVLEGRTHIPPRGQKLIHKGKVLSPEQKLEEAKVMTGSKIMLLASIGVHAGGGAGSSSAESRAGSGNGIVGGLKRLQAPPPVALLQEKARQDAWVKTGIVALRERSLQVVPGAVWAVGSSLRVLDLGGNALRSFPASVSALTNLQRLRLSSNALTQTSIAWEALTRLPHLVALALDHNQISALPPLIGQLKRLRRLALSHNTMASLPPDIGQLWHLEWLDVAHNRLAAIPPALADCRHLVEVNYSANFVSHVPDALGRLHNLKVLLLNNNALKYIPPELLLGCSELLTLELHGNQITADQLRQVEGWAEYDARRRAKYNKQIDFHAMGTSGGFEEGADAQTWHHW